MPRVLVASDSPTLVDKVQGALGGRLAGSPTTFEVCATGQAVVPAAIADPPDLVVLDLQIGNMGGMAVSMALRLDASVGRAPETKIVMLLDRQADVHLALRSGADGWVIKPLDALRLRRAATVVLDGGEYQEGVPPEGVAPPGEPARAG